MKRRMFVEVQGKSGAWVFRFDGDPAFLDEWAADGLKVGVVEYTIPAWVVEFRLQRPWCAIQRAWQFLRLW